MKVGSLGGGQRDHPSCRILSLLAQSKCAANTDWLNEVFSKQPVRKEPMVMVG